MKLQGHCERCQAPLFLNQCTDWYGNSVVTINCWNGHYSWIKVEDLEELDMLPSEPPVKTSANPVTHIGFFSLK